MHTTLLRGVLEENEAASSQKQQDDALEAKEASQVNEVIPSKNKLKVDMLLKIMKIERMIKIGKVIMKIGKVMITIMKIGKTKIVMMIILMRTPLSRPALGADDKTEEENDENVCSTPAEAFSSGRDSSRTSTEIVVKNIRFDNYNLKMLIDVHADLEGDIMTCAFEVIPHLRHQVKDFPEEVPSPQILRWMAVKNKKAVVHPWIVPTKDELKMEFLRKRDLARAKKDDVAFKEINEVVVSYAAGDATRTYDDHHSCGGGYTPLNASDASGSGGRYTPAVEEVQCQEDTLYMLGRSSAVGASIVPFCACECLKCNENMNMLLSKIEALIETQGVTEAAINKLIYKRGIYPSLRISEPFTPVGVKRRRNQISRALASAKKRLLILRR
ncbi:hypothetical protein HAX54_035141 [Datura stramonium]|uniref:Uncharacterized protein n=1 Tax=Datura stramonium TaxID=4076 RepID=A0ABS8VG13_DATST|nr:hypothetical protein [Datura stramonium]